MVSLKYQLQGSFCRPQTMVAPYLGRNPACWTAGRTPNSSSTGMLAGSRDSPTWSLGKVSRSNKITDKPWRAIMVAAVLPPGPPPMTTASARGFAAGVLAKDKGFAEDRQTWGIC